MWQLNIWIIHWKILVNFILAVQKLKFLFKTRRIKFTFSLQLYAKNEGVPDITLIAEMPYIVPEMSGE